MRKDHHLIFRLLATCVLTCCAAQLGCRDSTTENSPEAMTMIDEQLKSQYREQLKRDPEKEFGPEYVRTTDHERSLIDEHGFDAIRLIYEDRNSANYFLLGEFPAECPWAHLNGKNVEAAIDTVFAPIADGLPKLTEVLKNRCKYLFAERTDETGELRGVPILFGTRFAHSH